MASPQEQPTEPELTESDGTAGESPVGGSRLRRWFFRGAVLAASFVLAAGLCGAVLWIVAPLPYHEWLVREAEGHIRARPMPNQVAHTGAGDPVRINKHGFRGPDYPFQKPPGTLRIEVFGGSAAFCFHAAGREKSRPGARERKLRQRLGMPVEVINLGLPGFGSFNSKINYLCFGRAFNPDAIIVYHTWNDVARFRRLQTRPYHPVAAIANKPLWQRIARATQIGRRARNFLSTVTRKRMQLELAADEGTGVRHGQPVAQQAFDWERQNFVDFVTLAQGDGVLPILVSQGSLVPVDNPDDAAVQFAVGSALGPLEMTVPLLTDTWPKVASIIEDVAWERGAVFVDGYRAVPHDLEHLRDLAHLHDAGSDVLAEEIARVLTDDIRFMQLVNRVRAEAGPATDRGRQRTGRGH